MSWFLDGLAVFFMVYSGVVGFKRGFIEELGRLIGLLLAVVIAISNSTSLFIQLNGIINVDEWIGIFLSFSLLFSATLIAARVLTKLVHIAMLSKSNQLMNYSLGFLFGTMKGFFVIIIFTWFIAILPLRKWSTIIRENSRFVGIGNQFRSSLVLFFNWEDPISLSESYLRQLTEP